MGHQDGNFTKAEFYYTQGLCQYTNSQGELCLLLCDVKNHLIREANLNTKQVRTISGITGERGHDLRGGSTDCSKQELASPWDIVPHNVPGQFIVAMAGTH